MKNEISVKMNTVNKKLVPPDGGWGWMIVLAYAVNMICTIPIIQGFGLLFRERCADLGITGTEISIIITVNSAFGMGLGLINGPLLRQFGCRKVAMSGALFYTVGLMLSAWANSFTLFLITYGILCSLGTSIMNSAFSLSLNSYFSKRRGRAVGFALTLTGLGQILAPQLMSFMMPRLGVTGTVAVLGAISFHTCAAALLLQPLSWHLKEDVTDVEITEDLEEDSIDDEKTRKGHLGTSFEDLKTPKRKRTLTESSMDQDLETENIYGLETLAPRRRSFNIVGSEAGRAYSRSNSQYDALPPTPTSREPPKFSYKWWESAISSETINLGSSVKIFDESRSGKRPTFGNDDEQKGGQSHALIQKTMVQSVKEEEEDGEDDTKPDNQEKDQPKKNKSILAAVVTFFDFDLLRDPIYVSIMLGMSIAVFAELNFSVLTPFILSDMSLDTDQIATVMSCLAITDLLLRGISPFIGEWINQPARVMYLLSLILLVAARTGLLFAHTYTSVILVGFALGVAKGIRTVYMTVVIASHVPIERLASATGLQMATNGIILLVVGPIVGVIRDKSGSYSHCIVFLNLMTAITIVMWTIDIVIRKIRGTSNREEKK